MTAYIYDAMNRLLKVTEPSGKTTVYTYDDAGNRASQTETEGADVTATTYTYDALNRLVRTSESLNGALSRTVDYAYDHNGNLLTVTSVTYTDGTVGSPVLEQNNTYDLLNQLIRTVTSDGTTVENTYNGDGLRVVKSAGSLAVTAEGAAVAEWGLTTAASSMIYFSKDLKGLQSSEGGSDLINTGNLDDLPDNAQEMYGKYDESGWKGTVPGQTPGTAAGSKYLNRDGKLPTLDSDGNSITYKEFDVITNCLMQIEMLKDSL